ncbi:MAG: 3-deoxy-manno-octulosonate cytidylyltransferase [Pirellulaceae bacterium]
MQSKIVIPARLESTRLPQKLLRKVGGKSILQWTYEAAMQSRHAASVVVAVDDPLLFAEVKHFGGQTIMTSPDCQSGTDRVAEIARSDEQTDVFVNVQGDEPEIEPSAIDQVIELLQQHPDAYAATLATPIRNARNFADPNCVKVVLAADRFALYFSRSPIPHPRDGDVESLIQQNPPICWQHIGLYAYRREALQWFTSQPAAGRLEQIEKLEQLRLLEFGKRIVVGRIDTPSIGIDTESDLRAFEEKYNRASAG